MDMSKKTRGRTIFEPETKEGGRETKQVATVEDGDGEDETGCSHHAGSRVAPMKRV